MYIRYIEKCTDAFECIDVDMRVTIRIIEATSLSGWHSKW